jgi:hypothetical protein
VIAFMHRQLTGGGTEADLRRMAGLRRGHDVHVFCARPRGPSGRDAGVRIVRGGRLVRLPSFAIAAPRAVARETWTSSSDSGVRHARWFASAVARTRYLPAWKPRDCAVGCASYHRAIL